MATTITPCPLCTLPDGSALFYSDHNRTYYRCGRCQLTHVPSSQFLSHEEERAEYDKHQNSPGDAGYRNFLGRLFAPLNARLRPASHGLDFGCGPGPTLSVMFEETGHRMSLYDPLYAPDTNALKTQYDFITASEVVEHLHEPSEELERLWSILKPGGWLGIMTKLARDQRAFANWHYKNDLTHVCFFSRETMEWLAEWLGAEYLQVGADVSLFRKLL